MPDLRSFNLPYTSVQTCRTPPYTLPYTAVQTCRTSVHTAVHLRTDLPYTVRGTPQSVQTCRTPSVVHQPEPTPYTRGTPTGADTVHPPYTVVLHRRWSTPYTVWLYLFFLVFVAWSPVGFDEPDAARPKGITASAAHRRPLRHRLRRPATDGSVAGLPAAALGVPLAAALGVPLLPLVYLWLLPSVHCGCPYVRVSPGCPYVRVSLAVRPWCTPWLLHLHGSLAAVPPWTVVPAGRSEHSR